MGTKNESHHRVLMLHIKYFDLILNKMELKYIYIFFSQERDLKMLHMKYFDLILDNKELKYIYFFHLQERDLKYPCKGGEKNTLT